ncbi:MAG TPA: BMP family ABC transporter substrate-binding protein [Firmicutes bacterium]|jgi:basic membrane protein A|nr:BMP family ABC transporter substrate-binding protein [Bacillota bacterium]
MKKLMYLGLLSIAAMSVITLSSCNPDEFKIALITDVGEIDDKSFNQGTWEGIKAYAEENDISHTYYKPEVQSTTAYVAAIDLAVAGGAEIIVTPGYLFEEPIFLVQDTYPNVDFVLIDGTPHNADYSEFRTEENVQPILFAEQQAGFLAGYGAVMEGFRSLGFMGGMPFPAVVRFGMGFVVGANVAAAELDVDVTMKYHYTGGFSATPEVQTKAATWYQQGVDAIFACGGSLGQSVMAAAEIEHGKVIGVDVNQSADSETVITSAMKMLGVAVQLALTDHFDGTWDGGTTWTLDASNDGIGLPTDTESFRFEEWTLAEYQALYDDLADGTIVVTVDIEQGVDAATLATFDATLDNVTITFEA